jgi:hypothetical protein
MSCRNMAADGVAQRGEIGRLVETEGPFQRRNCKADIISGDRNLRNRDLQTFNPLFPQGA